MTEIVKKHLKTCCIFAKISFRPLMCDSNHKKHLFKSLRIAALLKPIEHLWVFVKAFEYRNKKRDTEIFNEPPKVGSAFCRKLFFIT